MHRKGYKLTIHIILQVYLESFFLHLGSNVCFIKIRTTIQCNCEYLYVDRILALATDLPHFKGFGMRNLQYEIRICQKSHNTVTITVYI